jgi:hypothetical protein
MERHLGLVAIILKDIDENLSKRVVTIIRFIPLILSFTLPDLFADVRRHPTTGSHNNLNRPSHNHNHR